MTENITPIITKQIRVNHANKTARCNQCATWYTLDRFYSCRGGLQTTCKSCMILASARRYRANSIAINKATMVTRRGWSKERRLATSQRSYAKRLKKQEKEAPVKAARRRLIHIIKTDWPGDNFEQHWYEAMIEIKQWLKLSNNTLTGMLAE